MEENFKGLIIIAAVILALFAGGLYYIFSENQNRAVTLDLVHQYITSNDPAQQDQLGAEIKTHLQKRPIALTSQASFGSFDELISNGYACDSLAAKQQAYDPNNQTLSRDEIWRDCMDHPEQLNKNSPR